MNKKLLFLLLSLNVCAIGRTDQEVMARRNKVILGGVIVVGGVIAAPFVLPAATIAAIQAAAVVVTTKVAFASAVVNATVSVAVTTVAGPTIGTAVGSAAGAIISVPTLMSVVIEEIKEARSDFLETEEEELARLKREEAAYLFVAKRSFQNCLMTNKNDLNKGSFGCSAHCQDTAFKFGLIAGQSELARVIKDTL